MFNVYLASMKNETTLFKVFRMLWNDNNSFTDESFVIPTFMKSKESQPSISFVYRSTKILLHSIILFSILRSDSLVMRSPSFRLTACKLFVANESNSRFNLINISILKYYVRRYIASIIRSTNVLFMIRNWNWKRIC